jgi:glycerol-3-phosphate acyltransferase PlsX
MKIAIDAMGGDNAPQAVVEGVVESAREKPAVPELILVGDESRIKEELIRLDAQDLPNISITHSSQTIEMHETPVLALRRKKDSSMLKCATLVKEGTASAFFSAGNTGAAVAATKIKWHSLPGVERPAIAVVMPSPYGAFVLLDVGATPDCRPVNLLQFAVMGDVYARYILNIKNPKVGLLSLGEEETKGTDLTKEVFRLLQNIPQKINFIGNIEGSDLFTEKVDVIVCDGFMGNVILKVCESLAGAIQHIIKEEIMKSFWAKMGAIMMKPSFKRIGKKVHYEETGGAPLLGVNGTCIIGHGRSSPRAVRNAIRVAEYMVKQDLNKHIVEAIAGT